MIDVISRVAMSASALIWTIAQAFAASPDYEGLARKAEDAYCSRQFKAAIELTRELLARASNAQLADDEERARHVDRIAGSYMRLGQFKTAIKFLRRAVELRERKYGKDSINSGFSMELLALALTKTGQIDEADRLYSRIHKTRELLIVGGVDPFRARRYANQALIALKRENWVEAFTLYMDAIAAIDTSTGPIGMTGDLVDLASEVRGDTFTGLATAAWQLRSSPSHSSSKFRSQVFQALQWRWRSAAAIAMEDAAARARASRSSAGAVRKRQDRSELLRALEAEREDTTQAWFAKRRENKAYRELEKERSRISGSFNTEKALSNHKKTMALSNKLMAAYKRCGVRQSRKCRLEISSLEKEIAELSSADAQDTSRLSEIGNKLYQIERTIPGVKEYERRSLGLQLKIERLRATGVRHGTGRLKSPGRSKKQNAKEQGFSPLSEAEVQRLLAKDEALITFLFGADRSFVWAITREKAVWKPLAIVTSSLEKSIKTLRQGLEPPALSGAESSPETGRARYPLETAYKLYSDLFGPIESVFKKKTQLIIVPNGPLMSLPLHALVTQPAKQNLPELQGYRQALWLGRTHAFSILPSVSAIKAMRTSRKSANAAKRAFIGFGDPDYSNKIVSSNRGANRVLSVAQRCSRHKFSKASTLDRLSNTKEELQEVTSNMGWPTGSLNIGNKATETRIKALNKTNELSNYDVLYFATHGLVTGEVDGLLEPALALSIPKQPTAHDDGLLTATEIARLNLNASLVVLSACNTSAERRPGEETLSGLARSFLFAGARTLLISHWHVDSFAAKLLVTGMFERMKNDPGLDKANALRMAMIGLIDEGDPVGAHPSYWAPFTIVGVGRKRQ